MDRSRHPHLRPTFYYYSSGPLPAFLSFRYGGQLASIAIGNEHGLLVDVNFFEIFFPSKRSHREKLHECPVPGFNCPLAQRAAANDENDRAGEKLAEVEKRATFYGPLNSDHSSDTRLTILCFGKAWGQETPSALPSRLSLR